MPVAPLPDPDAPEGAVNFRDLGGWPTEDGGRVRTGLIYRSGELEGLSATGWAQLAALGVGEVWDLRAGREPRPGSPGAAAAGLAVHRVPMWDTGEPGTTLSDRVVDGEDAGPGVVADYGRAKVASYVRMVDAFAPCLGAVAAGLGRAGEVPSLFHCAAGKDRTGLVAAVVLRAVGAGEDVVMEDYLLSRARLPSSRVERYLPRVRALGGDEAEFARVHAAHPPALAAALRHIEDRWGSVDGYLTGPAGLDAGTIATLREVLVERAPS